MTEVSFSMAITWVQRPERANAMALPPAPANMSIMVVLEGGVLDAYSFAIWLRRSLA